MSELNAQQRAALEYSERYCTTCCCGGTGWFRVPAPNTHILFGAAIPCVCQRDTWVRERADKLRRLSGMGRHMLTAYRFSTFTPEKAIADKDGQVKLGRIARACQGWAEKPDGWLILVGAYGSGKTHLAASIANRMIERDRGVYMATMPDLLEMLRGGYQKDATASFDQRWGMLSEVPLLIVDDLGSENQTDWALEQLYRLINKRYEDRLPMVVTSNLDPRDGKVRIEERVRSRLLTGVDVDQGWTRVLLLPAGDYRRGLREG